MAKGFVEPPLFDILPLARPSLRAMAVDLALDKTGLALTADGLEQPLVVTYRPGSRTGHEREDVILAELTTMVNLYRPEVILLEDIYIPVQRSPGKGFLPLAFLHGIVRRYLDSVAPYLVVNTSHLKIFAVGKGSGVGTDKHDIMLAIERRYRHLVTVADDNQADAFTLLAMVHHYYGCPLSTVDGREVPKAHLRALTMITDWPVLT